MKIQKIIEKYYTSNKLVKKIEQPISTKIKTPVTRCSITPINL